MRVFEMSVAGCDAIYKACGRWFLPGTPGLHRQGSPYGILSPTGEYCLL